MRSRLDAGFAASDRYSQKLSLFSKRYYLVFVWQRFTPPAPQESTLSRMLLTFAADCRAVRHLLRIVDAVYDQIRVRY